MKPQQEKSPRLQRSLLGRLTLILCALLLTGPIAISALVAPQSGRALFEDATREERINGPQAAIPLFQRVLDVTPDTPSNRALRAEALLQLGLCHERLGRVEAKEFFAIIVKDYADQAGPVREAQARLKESGPRANPAIFTADIDPGGWEVRGSRAPRLTTSDMFETEPMWSPDGKYIAFIRSKVQMGQRVAGPGGRGYALASSVYVRSVIDETEQPLGGRGSPFFYHDGQTVLFVSAEQPASVGLGDKLRIIRRVSQDLGLNAADPSLTGFVNPAEAAAAWVNRARQICAISNDDRQAYCLTGPGQAGEGGVVVIDLLGWKIERRFELPPTGLGSKLMFVSLSPDGSTLAFVRGNRLERAAIQSDPGPARNYEKLLSGIGALRSVHWTKQDHGILFARASENNRWQILRIPEQGGEVVFTGLEVTDLTSFSLSPDGTKIAFDGTDYSILSARPFDPPPPPPPPATPPPPPVIPIPPSLSGVWRLNPEASSPGVGANPSRDTMRQYATQSRGRAVRSLDVQFDAPGGPTASVSSAVGVGAERQMYTERALWEYLLHNRREDNLTVEVSALDQSVVTFNDKNGDAITSTRAVTVSGDNARLTETRERFDSSGRHIGTDLLVFDRIYSNFTPPTIPQNRGALAVSSIPIAGAWALNAAASVAPQTSYDLRRYEDLGQGSLGYLRVTLDKDGAPGLSIAILKADAADPAQAFRLSHPFGTLASIYAWLNNGTVPPTGMTYRVIDAYTSEMLIGNIHTRTVVARDGMRLTETQKTLNNSGEQTGESILVYDRIAP